MARYSKREQAKSIVIDAFSRLHKIVKKMSESSELNDFLKSQIKVCHQYFMPKFFHKSMKKIKI